MDITIQEGNKLIYEFLGHQWQPGQRMPGGSLRTYDIMFQKYDDCMAECNKINAGTGGSVREISLTQPLPTIGGMRRELEYHSSWDWLMPVVEKIEQGNYGFKMCRKVVEIYWDDSKELILKRKEKSRIESLWIAVVDFIQWYNSLPHPTNTHH